MAVKELDLKAATPQLDYEHIEVVFPATADQDLPIKTILRPENPENIYWEIVEYHPVGVPTPFVVYKDGSKTRKAWYAGVMFMRCTAASIRVVLRFYIPRPKPNA